MKNDLIVVLAHKRKTIADVHRETGISKALLTSIYYEQADNPDVQTLLQICNYLEITLDQLVSSSNYNYKKRSE